MSPTKKPMMNPLAEELNETILKKSPPVLELLSLRGKRMFFPSKGIIAQAEEAKKKASPSFNATAGIATGEDGPLVFPAMKKYFNHLKPQEIFNYSPSYGNLELRKLWKERLSSVNPGLKDKNFSLPIVSGGLTNSLSTVADLFLNPSDEVIVPDQLWGNYRLMLDSLRGVKIKYYPFFREFKFNLAGLKNSLKESASDYGWVKVILNFPNNPTGYSPDKLEQEEIIASLKEIASLGNKVLVILDEAYHTMFYEDNLMQESFFSHLVDAHENLLAVKICGATKEFFAWGFRVGFITYGIKDGDLDLYDALEKKTGGVLRANISNASTSAQNVLVKILQDKSYLEDFEKNFSTLKARYQEVKRVLENKKYEEVFTPYPFNSGYFMLIKLNPNIEAESMRKALLDHAQIGTIATGKHDLRIAFSCLLKENISKVFEKIYEIGKKHYTI